MTQNVNPFDTENLLTGVGLWDCKVVTMMSAKTTIDPLTRKDGTPVLDERTGQQAIRYVLQIVGIADDEEKERRETYSVGRRVLLSLTRPQALLDALRTASTTG